MEPFDIIVMLIILLMAILGYKEGILRQLGKLGAIVAALISVNLFTGALQEPVDSIFPSLTPGACIFLGDILMFVLVYVIINLFAENISDLFIKLHLGWIDSILGALFSAAKTLLIMSIVLYVILLVIEDVSFLDPFVHTNSFNLLFNLAPDLFYMFK